MRLFLGIEAENLILKKDQFNKLKVSLKNKNIEHRFEAHDQLHITMVSLGDMRDEDYAEREGYINNIVQGHEKFDLKLQGVYAFPNQKEGRVLSLGVQNTKELRSLHADLYQQISSICEFDYKPILPIVRLRNHKNVTDIISPYKTTDFGKLTVEKVVLFEMISGGAYPVFKALKSYYLSIPLKIHQTLESGEFYRFD